MGCTSSTMRRPGFQTERASPGSPLSSLSSSDVPVMALESPPSATRYHEMSTKFSTRQAVQPATHRLRRRRRQEPHLNHHLFERLEPLARYLDKNSKVDVHDVTFVMTQHAIDDLNDNIKRFFTKYASEKRTLWRLAQTGRVVQQVERFHRAIDAITARCGLAVISPDGISPALPRWQPRWRRMRAERLSFFRSYLEDHERDGVASSRMQNPQDQLELLTLLKYEVGKFDSLLTADELGVLNGAFAYTARSGGMKMDPQMRMMSLPEWFVAPYERTKQQQKWQRAAVTVYKVAQNRDCFAVASMWSRLQFAHIMKLYGACHVGPRKFFVVSEGIPLTRCLKDEGFPLWRCLHEAALALRFLHERQVGVEALSCADLLLFRNGDRDVIMLAGFNFRHMKSAWESSGLFSPKTQNTERDYPILQDDEDEQYFDDTNMINRFHEGQARVSVSKSGWQAPEFALGPTEASDVFALGMCAIEAFSGGDVWSCGNVVDQENAKYSLARGMPPRPASLPDDRQWALVKRMCCINCHERPSLTEVLASFQIFAEDEQSASEDLSSSRRRRKVLYNSAVKTQPRATTTSIACILNEVKAWCDAASEISALNFQLCERMEDVVARVEPLQIDHAESLGAMASLVMRFRDMQQRHANENPLFRLAATRQILETNKTLHEELDVLMDTLGLGRSGASIHVWSEQHEFYGQQLWQRVRLSLGADAQILAVKLEDEEGLSLLKAVLYFELNKRSASYSASDLKLLKATLAKLRKECKSPDPTPSWFVPPYEVVFSELDSFRRGDFGSVHFGKWLELDVVVKKIVPSGEMGMLQRERGDSHEQFVEEMSVWSELKHPNVLKLFGACHVGSCQFILSEFASLGSIDSCVASKVREERGNAARRLLHEGALGLHYLHLKGVVHADLRCSNILVDAHGVVKLTDFGFCMVKSSKQLAESPIGRDCVDRSRWIAPECLDGGEITFASNVYSFAMCAIEVITGDLPWGGEVSVAMVRSKVRKGELPPRPARCFSDSEWKLIEQMCCPDPRERITIDQVVGLLAGML